MNLKTIENILIAILVIALPGAMTALAIYLAYKNRAQIKSVAKLKISSIYLKLFNKKKRLNL